MKKKRSNAKKKKGEEAIKVFFFLFLNNHKMIKTTLEILDRNSRQKKKIPRRYITRNR